MRCRPVGTTQIAQMMPKAVFRTVATPATIRLSQSACSASGELITSQAPSMPGSIARQNTIPTGKAISSVR